MIVVCPQCGNRNRLPEVVPVGKKYRCGRCKGLLPEGVHKASGSKTSSASRQGEVRSPRPAVTRLVGAIILCFTIFAIVGGTAWTVADKVRLQTTDSMDVVMYPDEILRKVAEPILKVGEEERALASLMENTMVKHDAVGLAAPQVGVSKRILVVEFARPSVTGLSQVYEVYSMVNPEIVYRRGSTKKVEYCLSLPRGKHVDVTRSEKIRVEYTDLEGQGAVLEATGQNARRIQHEIDHLDGILILDYSEGFRFNTRVLAAVGLYAVVMLAAILLYARRIVAERKAMK